MPETVILKRLSARNHKETCECKTCQRVRETHARAEARKAQGLKPRAHALSEKETNLVNSLASQIVAHGGTNQKTAGEIAGYSEDTVTSKLKESRIRDALRSALREKGFNEVTFSDKLIAGTDANDIRVFMKKDGTIVREEVPNWQARHKFLETAGRTLIGVFGVTNDDKKVDQTVTLNVIAPVSVVPGHPHGCPCPSCAAGRQKSIEYLKAHMAIPDEFAVEQTPSYHPRSEDDDKNEDDK